MTTWVVWGVLCVLAAGVFRPLWSRPLDPDPGPEGNPDLLRRAAQEQAAEELQGLEQARDEGKISAADCTEERDRIRARLAAFHPEPAAGTGTERPVRRPATYPLAAVLGCGAVAVLTLAITLGLDGSDIRRGDFASGIGEADGSPPLDAEGQPDIAAMLARLETRVLAGQASPENLDMLERSYEVLGRGQEIVGFLRGAVAANPEDPILLMALGIRLFEAGAGESEVMFDRVIGLGEEYPVAFWFKSLILAGRGDSAAAIRLLRHIEPMVQDNPPAARAVAEKLADLTGAAASDASRE